jgi:glutamate-1-semialdehyde 2,1-aminomutase
MRYGVANDIGQVTRDEVVAILACARSSGFNTLDTAIAYGDSEQRLGEIGVLEWQVISKLPPLPDNDRGVGAWVRESVLGSLQRLRIPKLYGLLLHRPLQLLGARGEALHRALVALKEEGKVDKIGVSIYSPEELDVLWPLYQFDIVQAPFNILDRRLATSGWLAQLHKVGTEVHVRSVFLQGLLLMAAGKRPDAFRGWQPLWDEWHRWLEVEKLTALQACLGYVLSQPEVDRVVLGVDSMLQLREIVASADTARVVPPPALASTDQSLINPSRWGCPMKTVAVIQARMGSMRFPNKVMRPICGTPLIGLLLKRLKAARRIDVIILATSEDPRNDALARYVGDLGYQVFRGSEDDVLDRYYRAAKQCAADVVVRITGDCPVIDPAVVDDAIALYLNSGVDYVSNVEPPTYPNGLETEVFSFDSLEIAWKEAEDSRHREHVTTFIRESSQFRNRNIATATDASKERWVVDEAEDFEVVQKIFEHFHPRDDFSWGEILQLRFEHPEWFEANRHLVRYEGAWLGKGEKLWKRAKRLIPGGNMLLAKRSEVNLPDRWPAYFSKAKGCRVWDLDGREYIDMSIMGNGANTLGYGDEEVDAAVVGALNAGNMSTFNCPEEVFLAGRLVEIHPWAEMVQLTRSGPDANAIAVRIARNASGRNDVAHCGYHTPHDWYQAAGMSNETRSAIHRSAALQSKGIPCDTFGAVFPFRYNDFSELQELVRAHEIGVIKMDVPRDLNPRDDFLKSVRKLASENGIVLIFDERASGFRETLGGLHKLHGVEPDMALFGDAMGNGYPIAAVIGKRNVMQAAQSTFIGSTFWTGRIGPTAALKTLEVMERGRSWELITRTGLSIGDRWQALANKYELPLKLSGLPALISFSFLVPNMLKYKTLITQEMLKSGFLASNSLFVCTAHTQPLVDQYFIALEPLFGLIRECEAGRSIDGLLEGPVCNALFDSFN